MPQVGPAARCVHDVHENGGGGSPMCWFPHLNKCVVYVFGREETHGRGPLRTNRCGSHVTSAWFWAVNEFTRGTGVRHIVVSALWRFIHNRWDNLHACRHTSACRVAFFGGLLQLVIAAKKDIWYMNIPWLNWSVIFSLIFFKKIRSYILCFF